MAKYEQEEIPGAGVDVSAERAARKERLNDELNALVSRVMELEIELRNARADERRARAALSRA